MEEMLLGFAAFSVFLLYFMTCYHLWVCPAPAPSTFTSWGRRKPSFSSLKKPKLSQAKIKTVISIKARKKWQNSDWNQTFNHLLELLRQDRLSSEVTTCCQILVAVQTNHSFKTTSSVCVCVLNFAQTPSQAAGSSGERRSFYVAGLSCGGFWCRASLWCSLNFQL